MEQPHDAGMLTALEAGHGTRITVIDRFVHHDGVLYLAADTASVDADGGVDAARLRTAQTAAGARTLSVHTSPVGAAKHAANDIPVPRSYEAVLAAAVLGECDGLILTSGSAWITLTRTEIQAALTRRRRLAAKAAAERPRSEP